MNLRFISRCFLLAFLVLFILMISALFMMEFLDSVSSERDDIYKPQIINAEEVEQASKIPIRAPVILWWTGFTGEEGRYKKCGKVECFFTARRKYMKHPKLKVFVFYGTDLKVLDLPLPRLPHHEWALLHEESPKNNVLLSYEEIMGLFNHTATFRRESDYPITTQHLVSKEWLESVEYLQNVQTKNEAQKTNNFSPIVYVHSDCDPPSDRDHYVQLLMKHIPVDSYGKCLNNKKLPPHLQEPLQSLDSSDFYKILSKYKFALAMENAICKDYITEKLWRPLMIGVVPIVFGSPSVKDLLPSNHSAIVITDFSSVVDLANYIKQLNGNDEAYSKYLQWKFTGITNPVLQSHLSKREWLVNDENYENNFISGFECFICQRIHENLKRVERKQPLLKHIANVSHYGCPRPLSFDEEGKIVPVNSLWDYEWLRSKKIAKAVHWFIEHNISFTKFDLNRETEV